jgi:hypothetical protein
VPFWNFYFSKRGLKKSQTCPSGNKQTKENSTFSISKPINKNASNNNKDNIGEGIDGEEPTEFAFTDLQVL